MKTYEMIKCAPPARCGTMGKTGLLSAAVVATIITVASAAPLNATALPFNVTQNSMSSASALAKQYHEQHTQLAGVRLCDHYVGVWYGRSSSGFNSANDHWKATPPSYKLSGGWKPGALAFWTNPSKAGHVAIGDEKLGNVYSTDYPTPLYVGHGSTDAIMSWLGSGYTFRGWYNPYF